MFLSFANGPGVASNPPGWARVYAQLDGRPLSVEAFKQAIRDGRTLVTNGPWLTFTAAGHGPGQVLEARQGDRLAVAATVIGADRLAIVGPDGVLAEAGHGQLACTVDVDGPTWVAAVARGPATGLSPSGLAHTTPVYVDVDGARVARLDAADWCLGLIDGLQRLLVEHGAFPPEHRERRLADYADLLDAGRRYYRSVRDAALR